MEKLQEFVKNQISEYLETSKVIDKSLSENFKKQQEVVEYKKNNPSVTFDDMRGLLLEIAHGQQFTTLAIKDLEGLMNRITVLTNLATVMEIDMSYLDPEDTLILENITQVSRLFYSVKNGELIELQPEIIAKFMESTTEKHLTEDNLKIMFNNI
jgi:hypothetical protein